MPKPIEEKILIVCHYRGYIAPLKMMGPVVQPIAITRSDVAKILMSGAVVHEVDPITGVRAQLDITTFNVTSGEKKPVVPPVVIGEPVIPTATTGGSFTPAEEPKEETPVEEPKTEVADETPTEEIPVEEPKTETETPAEEPKEETEVSTEEPKVEFKLGADGKVDETAIDWTDMSKAARKKMRASIDAFNTTAGK